MRRLNVPLVLCVLMIVGGCDSSVGPEAPAPPEVPAPTEAPTPVEDEPGAPLGAACQTAAECESDLCLSITPDAAPSCSRRCDLDIAPWCANEGLFCLPIDGESGYVCQGVLPYSVGDDGDGGTLWPGDQRTRRLGRVDDADLYLVRFAGPGPFRLYFEPASSVATELLVFGKFGEPLDVRFAGLGALRAAVLEASDGDHAWLLVRNVGQTTSDYAVGLTRVEEGL